MKKKVLLGINLKKNKKPYCKPISILLYSESKIMEIVINWISKISPVAVTKLLAHQGSVRWDLTNLTPPDSK